MTPTQWLNQARDSAEKLTSLVAEYHPSYRRDHRLEITAPGAEAVCEMARHRIKSNQSEDPVNQLAKSLALGDADTAYHILNDVWFGVPESTSCWNIVGFKEAVDLLDDPPDGEEIA